MKFSLGSFEFLADLLGDLPIDLAGDLPFECGFSFITELLFTKGVGATTDSSNLSSLLELREPEAPRAIGGFLFGEGFRNEEVPVTAASFFKGVPDAAPPAGGFFLSLYLIEDFCLAGDSRFAGDGALIEATAGCSLGYSFTSRSWSSAVLGRERPPNISASSAYAACIIFLVNSSALDLAISSGSVLKEAAGFNGIKTSSSSSSSFYYYT